MGGSHDRRKLRRSQAPTPAAPNPVTSVSSIPAELKKDSPNFWRHVKAAVGWEGISFVTLSGFGLGFFFADRFGSARVFFWLAAASLVGRVVAYSRGNFSRHWKWSTPLTFGAIVLVLQLWIVIPWTYRTQIGHAPQKTVQIQEPQNEPPEIRAAEDRLHDDPEHLTLRDLLLTDFWPNTECHIGEVTLPLKTKPTVTLGVFFDREMASKFLAFYIPKQDFKRDLTGVIAAYLAAQYQYFLDRDDNYRSQETRENERNLGKNSQWNTGAEKDCRGLAVRLAL